MAGLTYTPDGGQELNLGKYAPGVKSKIVGRWGRHPIPGQQGDLKEDLGDGSLSNSIHLEFVGATAPDYYTVMEAISKGRRGRLLHPRRGSRNVVIMSISEEVLWTDRGEETTLVDIEIEDAVVGQAFEFKSGPSARAQEVGAQADASDAEMATLYTRIFARPSLQARTYAALAQVRVDAATAAARAYAAAAQESFSLGLYGPSVQAQLKALPPTVQAAEIALRLVGPAADIQATILSLEVMLFAATQLDIAIRAAQPVPIQTTVTRQPGQSIYAFVQQHYGRSGKTPSDMRFLVGLILRLNRQIRRPSLIPAGMVVVRPV